VCAQATDTLGYVATRSFTVTIVALAPFLDNIGPTRTVTDLKTVAGLSPRLALYSTGNVRLI
jgi:hypothetical protein